MTYPFTMKHPAHAPAVLCDADAGDTSRRSSPARFPDVMVENAQQEELSRSRGYLRIGETVPTYSATIEYPKLLSHPDHVPFKQATKESVVHDGKVIVVDVPAVPERFPDKTVNSASEEEAWAEKGYFPAGHFDGEAYEKALCADGEPGDEYPKAIYDEDGNMTGLEQDPDLPVDESKLYPMMIYVDGKEIGVANNAADAEKLRARGSAKNEPARRQVPTASPSVSAGDFAEWQEFQAFKAWKDAQAAGADQMIETKPGELLTVEIIEKEKKLLLEQAEELGIHADKRWGVKKLQSEIDVALSK